MSAPARRTGSLLRSCVLAVVAGLIASVGAMAQGRSAPAPDPPPGTPGGAVTAALVRLDRSLLASGVHLRLTAVDNFAANLTGGWRQGSDNAMGVVFGADLDLARLIGLPGGQIHVTFAQYAGRSLSGEYIGSANKVQNYNYPYKQFELAQFSYEQRLLHGRLDLLVGRINATGQFARVVEGCHYENAIACPFTLTDMTGGFTGFPYVNWGGRVRYRTTRTTYVKAGAFEINPTRLHNSGFTWSTRGATGVIVPVEIGYRTTIWQTRYPSHFALGGWYNSAPYRDPYFNSRGQPRGLFGGKPLLYAGGRGGLYATAEQVVYRPDRASHRDLTLFAVAGAPFDTREVYAFQAVVGALWKGPFAARPFDQFAVLASYVRFSNREIGYLNDLLFKAHSPSGLSPDQFIFEVNYGVPVAPGVVFYPDMQYIVNPDTISHPGASAVPGDAFVIGTRLVAHFH